MMKNKIAAVLSGTIFLLFVTPIQIASALDLPAGLTATGNRGGSYNDGTVTLNWSSVAGATNGYAIETLLNDTRVGDLTPALGQGTTTAIVGGLQGGTTYGFKIRAVAAVELSGWSTKVTANPITNPSTPNKPTHSNSLLDATVRWSAPASDGGTSVSSYLVTEVNSGRTQSVNATTFSAQFTAFPSGSKIKFNVRAINGVTAEGTASANSDETTLPQLPEKVNAVTAAKTANKGELLVTWTIPGNGGSSLTGFDVFLRQSGSDVKKLEITNPETKSTTFTNLTAGSYTVQVLAKSIIGSGPRSNEPNAVSVEEVPSSGGGKRGNVVEATPTPTPSPSPTPSPTKKSNKKSPDNSKKKFVTASSFLPKNVVVKIAKFAIKDGKGRIIKNVKVSISKKGKVTAQFPKGTKPGIYTIKITDSKKKVWYLRVKIK
ncbi:unannotated protein [freshwater metagenome]|uniref:Unannotated protein n=1 Tax=freshwater metagenome TaxID=449393 RepID=A0A6J7HDS9_9ZZZZ|nr:hypothetical protein [Actinomycetota bacterium]